MGLELLVEESIRLPQLTTVAIPDGVDDVTVRKALLDDLNIEIGGGLGAFKGKAWRVGLMGHTAHKENVVLFLSGLESVLFQLGAKIDAGRAQAAAQGVWSS